jgi:hypothetical protein
MDILRDLDGPRTLTGYRCFMHRLRADTPDLAEQAQRGIDARDINAEKVAAWLRDHGAGRVTGQQIRNHRGGKCVTCLTTS